MHDGSASRSYFGLSPMPVLVNVLEYRKAERNNSLVPLSRTRQSRRWSCMNHALYAADEQIVFVAEVHIESRPANIGAIKNLLHDDGVIVFFANEGCESTVQKLFR